MKNVDGIEIDSKMLNLMKKAQSISLIIYQMCGLSLPRPQFGTKDKVIATIFYFSWKKGRRKT
jgi:hypothetical protein